MGRARDADVCCSNRPASSGQRRHAAARATRLKPPVEISRSSILILPALYDAWHLVDPIRPRDEFQLQPTARSSQRCRRPRTCLFRPGGARPSQNVSCTKRCCHRLPRTFLVDAVAHLQSAFLAQHVPLRIRNARDASAEIGNEILQYDEMWLEFKGQVAAGLSRGCGNW